MARKRLSWGTPFHSLAGMMALTAAVLALSVGPAAAQGEISNATGAIINGGRIAPADCPPGGGSGPVVPPGAGLVSVGAVQAACTNAGAQASAANATIGTCPACVELGVIQSECTTGPAGTASSSVVVLSGGGVLPGGLISAYTDVNLGLLRIQLNEPINTATTRGFNALHVTGLGLDIIVAQSQCTTQAGYPLSEGIDTNAVAQQLAPAPDAGSDGAPHWLVITAAAAVLIVVSVVFLGSVRRRRVTTVA
ncbi:MAG TPA: hypothetical protein VG078_11385 [Acidimicrobiales bacterium]|nr:hypothetical protein [Acidimicrobiales bacterium]